MESFLFGELLQDFENVHSVELQVLQRRNARRRLQDVELMFEVEFFGTATFLVVNDGSLDDNAEALLEGQTRDRQVQALSEVGAVRGALNANPDIGERVELQNVVVSGEIVGLPPTPFPTPEPAPSTSSAEASQVSSLPLVATMVSLGILLSRSS